MENLLDFANVLETPTVKGWHGWKKETLVPITAGKYLGRHLQIHTMKSSSGLLHCSAQVVTVKPNGYEFIMFQDPSFTLFSEKKTATEKNITAVHTEGVRLLKERAEKNDWQFKNQIINW